MCQLEWMGGKKALLLQTSSLPRCVCVCVTQPSARHLDVSACVLQAGSYYLLLPHV